MTLRSRLKPRVMLDLTPLIDVVIQLIVFFMISSVFNTAPGIELDLPDSSTSETVEIDELRITIVGEDEIYLNRNLIALSTIGETLRDWRQQGRISDDSVLIMEGDAAVPYETIIDVLDQARRGGMDAVNLITAIEAEKP